MKLHIGTSGFSYQHWRGIFYPDTLPEDQWLEFYARRFDGVEINSSFYHLPFESVIKAWYRRTPGTFTFVLKGSRFVTHRKRLKDCRDSVDLFYRRARLLKDKLAAVLWQLPPRFKVNRRRLATFLGWLPPTPRAVIEFRDPSWFCNDAIALLEKHRAGCCVHDMPASQCPDIVTGGMVYLRFHGTAGHYSGSYSTAALRARANWVRSTHAAAVFAFFNNDADGAAVTNAQTLRRLLM